MNIGIDKIGFYTPHLYVDMNKLAVARDIEPEKFTVGIGQEKMAIPPITQDPVTLAANAALGILNEADKEKIDFVIFGTESGIDNSKSAGVYVHNLLGLNPHARTVEMKQACYGATAGIQLAKGHIALNPESKVLVIGSDIARYGLNTPGESTQGAGAVAMVISANPRIMVLEEHSAYFTNDIMDFWRPIYSDKAFVDGKFSNEQYIYFFSKVWEQYKEKSGLELKDFEAICYHLPYTKMGLKALRTILDEGTEEDNERLVANYQVSTQYNRNVGNIYTGSLYLSLLSLLELNEGLEAGSRVGLYSYGSGAVGEFFTGILQSDYREHLHINDHKHLFDSRMEVTVPEYEKLFEETLPVDGSTLELDITKDTAAICLSGVEDNKRLYVRK
ncbi:MULTISPECIES: hydroxymethylglutaryl-CoA synthase [Oceanobacillus]|uniref:Hydroxymethylglutaryl-CoA synthase n=1 Tax=Oceanobacillus profundus TaxID=372463 RepID=A0A417YBE1_9BACI|nr:hydroxymethylglutaryl-CoA synthase [Oceanobacillus profundus]MBR3119647.1 hydroxymethylglutaryl-CoA synthase [Oceanobacillus sp.]MCM3398366.1 hydroxymethylglutaryl-CoA synthase [Oceanobacillus profundus]PAE30745.1 hydroxymethylglutaryl-CoA synthase [Paenibacillus sp. 7884-2]RHW29827.1 hydroxymethylglutaryl-CoA synthase [Oceanobacillus profundus]